jgi:hypothetical protein
MSGFLLSAVESAVQLGSGGGRQARAGDAKARDSVLGAAGKEGWAHVMGWAPGLLRALDLPEKSKSKCMTAIGSGCRPRCTTTEHQRFPRRHMQTHMYCRGVSTCSYRSPLTSQAILGSRAVNFAKDDGRWSPDKERRCTARGRVNAACMTRDRGPRRVPDVTFLDPHYKI